MGAGGHPLAPLDSGRSCIDKCQNDTTISLKLQAQSREASADMQIKYQDQIKELREKRAEMAAEYDKIEAASIEAWKDFKTGADEAWDNMSKAMKSAWGRFG